MAAKRQTKLTEEQVLAAILDSEEYSSLSEDSDRDDSPVEDFYDEDGQAYSFNSVPTTTVQVQFIPDPCDMDSLFWNVCFSTIIFCSI